MNAQDEQTLTFREKALSRLARLIGAKMPTARSAQTSAPAQVISPLALSWA